MSEQGCQVKNHGNIDRVLIRNHHPAVISQQLFENVQRTKLERSKDALKGSEMKMIF